MIVPPIPLYTVHGKADSKPTDRVQWTRCRVIFIDDDGCPWIVGRQPDNYRDGKFNAQGDKTLKRATEFSDYLGISNELDSEVKRVAIPAAKGWRVIFGCQDDGDLETWIDWVAGWSVTSHGCLVPIPGRWTETDCLEPVDLLPAVNVRVLKIIAPGESEPSDYARDTLVREAFGVAAPTTATTPAEPVPFGEVKNFFAALTDDDKDDD